MELARQISSFRCFLLIRYKRGASPVLVSQPEFGDGSCWRVKFYLLVQVIKVTG